jgi:hypothetical protein
MELTALSARDRAPVVPAGAGTDVAPDEAPDPSPGGARYVCAQCGAALARPRDEVRVDGRVRHTFANPGGYVHQFVTVARCEHVATVTPPSAAFAWFAGYAWQVLCCARCGGSLGWRFGATRAAAPPEFFGLILERIRLVAES